MNWIPFLPSLFFRPNRIPVLTAATAPDHTDHKFKIIETGHGKYLIKDSSGYYFNDSYGKPSWFLRDSATEFNSLNACQKKLDWLIKHYTEKEI